MKTRLLISRPLIIIFCTTPLIGCSALEKKPTPAQPTSPVSTAAGIAPSDISPQTDGITYDLPKATQPEGQVTVKSFGVTELRNSRTPETLPALHVQMSVHNNANALKWDVDSRLLTVSVATSELRPNYVRAPSDSLPIVSIDKGESKTLDLFYVLPPNRRGPEDVQSFTFDWQLNAGQTVVSESTSFTTVAHDIGSMSIFPAAGTESDGGSTSGTTSAEGASLFSATPLSSESPSSVDPIWWADPFTDLPFPWRDFVQ